MFTRQDIAVRYKQTLVGVTWVVMQPVISSLIFAVIFGIFAKFPSGDLPYFLFVFSGLITWQLISKGITEGSSSLVSQSAMLTKIYFPRAIPAIVPTMTASVDFILALAVLVIISFIQGYIISWQIIFLPLVIIMAGILAMGIAMIFAPINAIYRDVGLALPYLIQILMFLSPIMYSSEVVPDSYRFFYDLNPIATVVNSVRWCLFDTPLPNVTSLFVFSSFTIFTFYAGLKNIARLEQTLIDRL
jgi:lipopolysaccharide transport system permease protein